MIGGVEIDYSQHYKHYIKMSERGHFLNTIYKSVAQSKYFADNKSKGYEWIRVNGQLFFKNNDAKFTKGCSEDEKKMEYFFYSNFTSYEYLVDFYETKYENDKRYELKTGYYTPLYIILLDFVYKFGYEFDGEKFVGNERVSYENMANNFIFLYYALRKIHNEIYPDKSDNSYLDKKLQRPFREFVLYFFMDDEYYEEVRDETKELEFEKNRLEEYAEQKEQRGEQETDVAEETYLLIAEHDFFFFKEKIDQIFAIKKWYEEKEYINEIEFILYIILGTRKKELIIMNSQEQYEFNIYYDKDAEFVRPISQEMQSFVENNKDEFKIYHEEFVEKKDKSDIETGVKILNKSQFTIYDEICASIFKLKNNCENILKSFYLNQDNSEINICLTEIFKNADSLKISPRNTRKMYTIYLCDFLKKYFEKTESNELILEEMITVNLQHSNGGKNNIFYMKDLEKITFLTHVNLEKCEEHDDQDEYDIEYFEHGNSCFVSIGETEEQKSMNLEYSSFNCEQHCERVDFCECIEKVISYISDNFEISRDKEYKDFFLELKKELKKDDTKTSKEISKNNTSESIESDEESLISEQTYDEEPGEEEQEEEQEEQEEEQQEEQEEQEEEQQEEQEEEPEEEQNSPFFWQLHNSSASISSITECEKIEQKINLLQKEKENQKDEIQLLTELIEEEDDDELKKSYQKKMKTYELKLLDIEDELDEHYDDLERENV